MNGLGNEFIVFDARERPVPLSEIAIRELGGQAKIGFDQMISIERSKNGADAFMRIRNRDGGEVDACGNATRCVGWLLMDENGKKNATIETNAGLLRAYDTGDAGADHRRHGQAALRVGPDSAGREFRRHPRDRTADRADRRADPPFALGGQHGKPARDLLGGRRRGL